MTAIQDPIAFELFKNALFSIADEMALTITRTTYSGVLKDNMDFSTAFADADGKLVAQGLTLPGHLGSIPTALDATMRHYGSTMAPGDIFIMNDPFDGGMHLPDIFVFKPLYVDGKRLAFAATVCHHTDVGGRVAGSNASDSTEIYQEGLRIPPLKMYDAGRRNDTLFAFIEKNVRVPVKVFGDLRAQLAACHIAERQFLELVQRYGADMVQVYMQEVIDYAERLTRAAIRTLPDGVYSFEDWIDDDGIDVGKPIRLVVFETYIYAIADAMRDEYEAVAKAGFVLQFDCPDLGMGRHIQYADLDLKEFRKRITLHIEALNHAVKDIPAEQLRMHLCWGNYEGPHHRDVALTDIIDIVFTAKPNAISLEGANPRHNHEWAVFETDEAAARQGADPRRDRVEVELHRASRR